MGGQAAVRGSLGRERTAVTALTAVLYSTSILVLLALANSRKNIVHSAGRIRTAVVVSPEPERTPTVQQTDAQRFPRLRTTLQSTRFTYRRSTNYTRQIASSKELRCWTRQLLR